ncbi:MAG: tRNA uridine-5-carboxymethylaminomethyl(34) synthesis GTPase MnmE [Desulfomicrobium sp.]|nr:tRNA uridine-5-carboxymethylaminomethyl(34) synthesis GTPase MnmE [Pseudomonadota bacterium]MBV1712890.1 tRNA uridine-5-carboxymethylaminomethyl(34) synthesis GTPase MnmE [Desulfomicrobium sp.]MBU4571860.1 tRNA uridine-5-carboxymethylaminomethyl(34) synthesis GTPase MnmE [Pseudomonadota bacterium]MBU4596009.1 tRNA uridine-5-carboxymethylaminomethyl(34) synthesis GTPase MnmE [Pseudomonadota bacterium]MBV1721313.1 tRNA uridine-5-carboxymethylaminomethyl(34) synthesis GTPase MnmE [Desulfomicrob
MKTHTDTIVAIATPPGQGAIGIVRLSGPAAREIAQGLFYSSRSGFAGFKPYRLHHGQLRDGSGGFLDEALAAFMPGPGSFTGEDVVELHCHGGGAILRRVVEECLRCGARLAAPGEFSKRAFLSGRMDLTQAEAIMELVGAPGAVAVGLAGSKLEGMLARRVGELRAGLEALRVQLCVAVDFPEDEVECLAPDALAGATGEVRAAIDELAANYDRGRCWREGALVVLAGQVNAGKSSLMNAILGVNRAIVTDIPGTTRDYLEESVQIDGLPVRLVDTAGLRAALDSVELMGIERSRELLARADLVLLVIDSELGPGAEDLDLTAGTDKLLVVANKTDLLTGEPAWLDESPWREKEVCRLSAKHGQGVSALMTAIRRMVTDTGAPEEGALVPNLRQHTALTRAAAELDFMLEELAASLPYDILSVRLDTACAILAEITGEITSEEVLNSVFDGFCIGK